MGSKTKITFGDCEEAASKAVLHPKAKSRTPMEMLTPASSETLSKSWQHERETLLHKICERIEAALRRGKPVRKTIRHMVKLYNGRAYKSDAKRKVQLTEATLIRLLRVWRRNGCVPSAFRFRYKPLTAKVPVHILLRFVKFCSEFRAPNLKAAWRAYVDARSHCGSGRRSQKPCPLTYEQAFYVFRPRQFRALQECLAQIHAWETELSRLRLMFSTEIERRFPPSAKRQWQRQPVNFEI